MRSLRYLNTILTLIAVLLTLNLWTAWTASPSAPSLDAAHTASAAADKPGGVGSTAERQVAIVNQLKALNTAVGNLDTTLTSGKVRVKVDAMPKAE